MNAPLEEIRGRLARLGRQRRWGRWSCGLCILISAAFWTLAALLLLDILFELDRLQRVIVMCLGSAVVLGVTLRYVCPYFATRETEVDLALLLQRLHGVDSDLVAAIEFTGPEATTWGSAALRNAVIHQVETRGGDFDMSRAVDRHQPRLKMALLVLTILPLVAANLLFPDHFAVFWRRLALGDEHYPSQTRISRIEVNRQIVLEREAGTTPRDARCVECAPVEFVVQCRRHPPASGELLIREANKGPRRILLERLESKDRSTVNQATQSRFVGRLPLLLDSLHYQVFLGDAWTDPARIEMIPLPRVELRLSAEPPSYSPSHETDNVAPGINQITVLEGSSVTLALHCINDKTLRRVTANLRTSRRQERCELSAVDDPAVHWQLTGTTSALLRDVRETVRFDLSVTDTDNLPPSPLPSGLIRVRDDLAPRVGIATVHQVVLPSARPGIAYRVSDDFGISQLRMQVQIERDQATDPDSSDVRTPKVESPDITANTESHSLPLDSIPYPLLEPQLPYSGRFHLELAPWQLHQGDRLTIVLETIDYRGDSAGALTVSKPLYLEVSDEAGVLSAILAADQRTQQDLDEMIERQMELGDTQ